MQNQAIKFLKGASPSGQIQKSNGGAETSIKKSKNTINALAVAISSHLLPSFFITIADVMKVSVSQFTPITSGTPYILGPKLFP